MLFNVTVAPKKDESKNGKTYTFPSQKIKIGRLKENDIVLDFPAVSGFHGKLRLVENEGEGHPQAFITDFGSLNGIQIDGHRIEANKETPIEFDQLFEICIFNLKVSVKPTGDNEVASNGAENDPYHSATIPLKGIAANGSEKEKSASTRNSQSDEEENAKKEESSGQTQVAKQEKSEQKKKSDQKGPTGNGRAESDPPEDKEEAKKTNDGSAKAAYEPLIKLKAGDAALEELELQAERLLSLWGMVKGPDDKPVPEVIIECGNLGKTETGGDGTFLFDDIPEGTDYKISLTKSGFQFDPAELKGTLDDELSFAVTAIELTTVKGRVLHQDTPLKGVEVNGGDLGKTETDKDGTFVFKEVPRNSDYSLKLSKSDFVFEPQTVQGQAGESVELSITPIKLVTVQGRVVHKGKPLEGVEIDAGPLGKTETDRDGVYKFEKVREDIEFTIAARKQKYNFKHNP